jgi:hypothetical protein
LVALFEDIAAGGGNGAGNNSLKVCCVAIKE